MALASVQLQEHKTLGENQEWVPCDLCGADDTEMVYSRGRFQMKLQNVICKMCGLVYVNPRMPLERYRHFCLEEYRILYGKPTEPTDDFRRMERERGEIIFEYVQEILPWGARVLEAGSRTGDLLDLFRRKRGCEVYGLEPDLSLATFASQVLSLQVTHGLFETAEFQKDFFDLVILCHVLEHAYSPTHWLEKVRLLLKKGGKLYIEAPNLDTPYGPLHDYFQNAHPYTFTPRTLNLMARKSGFSILKSSPYPPAYRLLLEMSEQRESSIEFIGDDYQAVSQSLREYERRYRSGLWFKDAVEKGKGWLRRKLRGLKKQLWDPL